jgi:hypothetical protein
VTEIAPFGIEAIAEPVAQIRPAEAVDFIEWIADRIQRQQRRLRIQIARQRLDVLPEVGVRV